MGLNTALMQKKLDSLLNPKSGNDDENSNKFKPQDGDQTIRVLPSKDEDPFKQFFIHYNLRGQKGGVLCPRRNFGEDCPVCDLAFKLWKDGAKENNDDTKKTAKDLFPKERYHSAIIVRGMESEGVKVWGYGKQAYEKMLRLVIDPDYGDITDLNEGTDLVMSYVKKNGESYPKTDLNAKRSSSPVYPVKGKNLFGDITLEQLVDSIPDLNTLYERKSSRELAAMLEQHLNSIPDDSEGEGTEKFGKPEDENLDTDKVGSKIKELLGDNA